MHDLRDTGYIIIDEYEDRDGYYMKVQGYGESFWGRFVSETSSWITLRVDQVLGRCHEFCFGDLIMLSQVEL